MEKIIVNDKATLDKLAANSALSFEGCRPSKENLEFLRDWINKFTAFKTERFYIVSGSLMNMCYHLTGDNAYPETECNIVCVMLDDIADPMKIAIPRFQIGGRWFDDIVDNNARRESEKANEDNE